MPYDINTTLERLEKNLSNLDSARKQVESMVFASNELQSTVENYVSSINCLYDEVKSWKENLKSSQTGLAVDVSSAFAQLKKSCEATATAFQNSSYEIVDSFKSRSEASLTKFDEQNTLLASRVQEMMTLRQNIEKAIEEIKSLKSSLSQIQRDLKDSQRVQDNALDDLKEKVNALPGTIKQASDAITGRGDLQFEKHNEILDKTKSVITGINTKVESLIQTTSDIQDTCKTIEPSIKELKESVNAAKDSLQKSITINRRLIIGGIVVLIILIITHFIS